jgi:hypothetical protein
VRVIFLVLTFLSLCSGAQQEPVHHQEGLSPQSTLLVECGEKPSARRVLGPIAVSQDQEWRAYVEVVSDRYCLHTTKLWVARGSKPYRLLYLMPPKRWAAENGMAILGWAENSRMLLVQTEEWQSGSDAPDTQGVLAFDADTGEVYEPQLDAILQERRDKQCWFRVTDAGFSGENRVRILVRVRVSTFYEAGEPEEVPPAKQCAPTDETWSFDFANGAVEQVANTEPLHVVKKFLPNKRVPTHEGATIEPESRSRP